MDQLERPWVRRKVEVGACIGERRGEVPTKGNERDFQCRRWPLVLGQLDMIGVHQVRHRYVRTSSLPELGDGIVESQVAIGNGDRSAAVALAPAADIFGRKVQNLNLRVVLKECLEVGKKRRSGIGVFSAELIAISIGSEAADPLPADLCIPVRVVGGITLRWEAHYV